MLDTRFTSVLGTRTRNEFQEEVVRFTKDIGFDVVAVAVVLDHHLSAPEFITVDNVPRGYKAAFENTDNSRRDPVLQHCKRQSVPIIWDQSTYVKQGLGAKWEEQAQYGIRTGIAMALHMPEGRHFVIGVDRDQPMMEDPRDMTRIVADLQLFAVHAHEAALRILTPVLSAPGKPSLTPRELETLRWTMEGKTAWEVGSLLGISERTAALHVNNATHKLGCVNKHQAVLKALRMGLIQ